MNKKEKIMNTRNCRNCNDKISNKAKTNLCKSCKKHIDTCKLCGIDKDKDTFCKCLDIKFPVTEKEFLRINKMSKKELFKFLNRKVAFENTHPSNLIKKE